jgi:putative membrane protein
MIIAGKIMVGLVALIHIYIVYLEMFAWSKPKGLRVFGMTQEVADASKTLAANQGLYNGFLAAGLIWGLVHPNGNFGHQVVIFFLFTVIVAAIYGALTVKKSILFMQGLPAFIALILVVSI